MAIVNNEFRHTKLRFAEEETTRLAMETLRAWVECHGIPEAIYCDMKSVFYTSRKPTIDEAIEGIGAQSEFGRACHELGIRLIFARSPQAKGRVERRHAITQDRLIKEMALDEIGNIEEANEYLKQWVPEMNVKFSRPVPEGRNAHRPVPPELDLDHIFCLKDHRTIGRDWTVRYKNRFFQIHRQPDLPPAQSKVVVHEFWEGAIHILYNGRLLQQSEINGPEPKKKTVTKPKKKRVPVTPAADHPWRQYEGAKSSFRTSKEEIDFLIDTYLKPPPQGYPQP